MNFPLLPFEGVPTTPDPNTSAKVSRHKWEAYRDTNWWYIYYFLLSAKKRAYFGKSIAIEMGGVSRDFSEVSGSGVDTALLIPVTRARYPIIQMNFFWRTF